MLGSSSSKEGGNNNYDYSFKILLIGDSVVGKSSLLVAFNSNFVYDLSPTIGVDFKIKMVTIGGKRLKLTIWDTGYRWILYQHFLVSRDWEKLSLIIGVHMGLSLDSESAVSREEGMALAQEHKCSFLECSAKTRENVHQCFKDLILRILEVPALLEKGSAVIKKQLLPQKQVNKAPQCNGCCCFQ